MAKMASAQYGSNGQSTPSTKDLAPNKECQPKAKLTHKAPRPAEVWLTGPEPSDVLQTACFAQPGIQVNKLGLGDQSSPSGARSPAQGASDIDAQAAGYLRNHLEMKLAGKGPGESGVEHAGYASAQTTWFSDEVARLNETEELRHPIIEWMTDCSGPWCAAILPETTNGNLDNPTSDVSETNATFGSRSPSLSAEAEESNGGPRI